MKAGAPELATRGCCYILEDPRRSDHFKLYVQDYLLCFAARKVEAIAQVVRREAGWDLCGEAILRYLPEDAPAAYEARLAPEREKVRREVVRLIAEGLWPMTAAPRARARAHALRGRRAMSTTLDGRCAVCRALVAAIRSTRRHGSNACR